MDLRRLTGRDDGKCIGGGIGLNKDLRAESGPRTKRRYKWGRAEHTVTGAGREDGIRVPVFGRLV